MVKAARKFLHIEIQSILLRQLATAIPQSLVEFTSAFLFSPPWVVEIQRVNSRAHSIVNRRSDVKITSSPQEKGDVL
jgi:hypothetical protein